MTTSYLSWMEKQTEKKLTNLKKQLDFPLVSIAPPYLPWNPVFRSTSSWLSHSSTLAKWSSLPSQKRSIFCTTKPTGRHLRCQEALVQAYFGGLLLLPFPLTQITYQVPDSLYARTLPVSSSLPYWPLGPRIHPS